jgi:hypothetical protein
MGPYVVVIVISGKLFGLLSSTPPSSPIGDIILLSFFCILSAVREVLGGWRGVVWCGVVWCGVVWCGVVWCGVVWCGVPRKQREIFIANAQVPHSPRM